MEIPRLCEIRGGERDEWSMFPSNTDLIKSLLLSLHALGKEGIKKRKFGDIFPPAIDARYGDFERRCGGSKTKVAVKIE